MAPTLEVRPDIARDYPDLLGPHAANGRSLDAAELIVALARRFAPDFERLLAARREFRAQVAASRARYAFADPRTVVEDADGARRNADEIRRGMLDHFFGRDTPLRWRLNPRVPIPAEVARPGLQGTGPCDDLGMAFSALNTGAASWMWDWEDAGNDYQDKLYRAWRNLREILSGRWNTKTYRHPEKAKDYKIQLPRAEWPVIFHRVPGIHLRSRQLRLDGRPVPAIIPALIFHALPNLDAQRAAGSGLYYYIPKIETPEEALLVARLLAALEEALGLPRGTIKVEMLNERARFAAAQELILWVMRPWLVGTNVGRWDYINSRIEMLKDRPDGLFPDPHTVGMTEPSMTEYTRRNAVLTLLVGGFPIGGMSAVMKNPAAPPEVNARAVRSIWFDKLRERLTGLLILDDRPHDGYRQSWVATTESEYVAAGAEPLKAPVERLPELVARLTDEERSRLRALGLLDAAGKIAAQVVRAEELTPERLFSADAFDRLFRRPEGPVTETGLRTAITMASEYMFQQLNGNNAAAIDDPLTGTRLMNDFATYEIFWHWLWTALRHQAPMSEAGAGTRFGERVTPALMKRLLNERTETVKQYFADQDRRGVKSRFDRSKAWIVMQILERQLLHPGWITYGSRVLDSIKEAPEPERGPILEAVCADSRDAVAAKVRAGAWPAAALAAFDYVYDVFAGS
jgi:malate synthase